jgi:DNA-binding IclR family transcriptional regulator
MTRPTPSAAPAIPAGTTPRATRPRGDTQVLSSVANAARLLKEFGGADRELGVTELSRRLGIGKSTTHRLLHTLASEKLLEQDPETGAYRLALVMHELGSSVQTSLDIHSASSPIVDQLRNITRETVQIAVLDGRQVVYVERREAPQTLRLFGQVGHRNDAHCTSTGKVLLAALDGAELDRTLAGWRLPKHTPYTITDQRALRAQLDKVRAQGWAENVNEFELGVGSLAAPIRTSLGETVAALSVAGPVQRLGEDSLRRFVRPVVEAAAAISRRLGWHDVARESGNGGGR